MCSDIVKMHKKLRLKTIDRFHKITVVMLLIVMISAPKNAQKTGSTEVHRPCASKEIARREET